MLGLVRHARACPRFSKITKQQYLRKGLSYFVYLLHVVTHPWKLQCYVVLVGYGPACPKFSEATNHQYLWKGCSDFVDFLQVVICILLDIHWSYKNMLFWVGIVRHSFSAIKIVRCCKLKKLKKDMRYWVYFLLPWKLEEILCYFGLWPQNTLGQSVCRIFYFWLVWLVKRNTGGSLLHCTCFCKIIPIRQKWPKTVKNAP